MSDEEKARKEKDLGQEAYKRKDYDLALTHYSNAARLNPKEMNFIYQTAKIHLEQKNYAESIRLFTKAIKVGKEQKANVKTVAKAMAMRGRAHKGKGETDKFEKDIEKAVDFLKMIAHVKYDKERWAECIDFCERALEMGKEENNFVDTEALVLQSKASNRLKEIDRAEELKKLGNEAYNMRDFDTALKHYNDAAKLNPNEVNFLNNIAAVKLEQGEYAECIEYCTKAINTGSEKKADPKKIEKALNRRARAQKLLDSASVAAKQASDDESSDDEDYSAEYERFKTEMKSIIMYQHPGIGPEDITFENIPKKKQVIAHIKGYPSQVYGRVFKPCEESFKYHEIHNGGTKSAPLPEVYDKDKFEREIIGYFHVNRLDPYNISDVYDVALKLYEKKNFKGCAILCRNTEICGVKEGSKRLAKVRALQGKAFRRDYGMPDDFEAKLAKTMEEAKGKRKEEIATVEFVQGSVKYNVRKISAFLRPPKLRLLPLLSLTTCLLPMSSPHQCGRHM